MTSQHCVSDGFCASFSIGFSAEQSWDRPQAFKSETDLSSYGCKELILAHPGLDFALVLLDRPVPAPVTPLKLARAFVPASQPLLVIGHPAGWSKQASSVHISFGHNDLCRASPLTFPPDGRGPMDDLHPKHRIKNMHSFEHDCSTLGGSSGSPVLDAQTLEVVGLHWGGWDNQDAPCTWGHYDPSPDANYDPIYQQHFHPANSAVLAVDIRTFLLTLTQADMPSTPTDVLPEIQQALE